MNSNGEETRERILMAALKLFLDRGIARASVSDIAYQAAVTRITVYRYFPDKRALVRAAFLRVESIFQDGLARLKRDDQQDWEKAMNQIGEELSQLPPGDVYARAEELKRVYPDLAEEIQAVRVETLNSMFDRLYGMAERHDLLRPGLNRTIVQAIFWELIINFFDNPRFKSFGLSDAELYRTMNQIFCYGIFKQKEPAGLSLQTPLVDKTEIK
jgi:AcrR family transcriptional regulator